MSGEASTIKDLFAQNFDGVGFGIFCLELVILEEKQAGNVHTMVIVTNTGTSVNSVLDQLLRILTRSIWKLKA